MFAATADKMRLLDHVPLDLRQNRKEIPALEIAASERPPEIQNGKFPMILCRCAQQSGKQRKRMLHFVEQDRIPFENSLAGSYLQRCLFDLLKDEFSVVPFSLFACGFPVGIAARIVYSPLEYRLKRLNQDWRDPLRIFNCHLPPCLSGVVHPALLRTAPSIPKVAFLCGTRRTPAVRHPTLRLECLRARSGIAQAHRNSRWLPNSAYRCHRHRCYAPGFAPDRASACLSGKRWRTSESPRNRSCPLSGVEAFWCRGNFRQSRIGASDCRASVRPAISAHPARTYPSRASMSPSPSNPRLSRRMFPARPDQPDKCNRGC